jgi:hypothetical protein
MANNYALIRVLKLTLLMEGLVNGGKFYHYIQLGEGRQITIFGG